MYSSLFEVSQWCKAVDFLGKKITLISCFGEISGSDHFDRQLKLAYVETSYDTHSGYGQSWEMRRRVTGG
ncbi:hypothetical protein POPTR_011G045912v4 [Populus trichocarpa]|uniref:Uncharacterized protein n=1 Tax=Populus trichocarpa TaxID=3694 RepID=A0ACC0S6Y8_POPTR|nr:hypothetical protein POPTR_011G045912v4 [Populus trichocarpa]